MPTSDIDLVMINKDEWKIPNPAEILEKIAFIVDQKKEIFASVKCISSASVPVLKLESSSELRNIKLDITVKDARHKGLECVEIVKNYLKQYPHLQPLLLLMKYMLKITELNDPYKGGLSSYGLLLMCVSFFQTKNDWPKDISIGKWLILIMHFYSKWNPHWTCIYPKPPFSPISVSQPVFLLSDQYSEVPIIVDPLRQVPPNIVTKDTTKMVQIQDILFCAMNSIWTDCNCLCHRRKKLNNMPNFADGKHKMLIRMFSAIQGCHKMHEMIF